MSKNRASHQNYYQFFLNGLVLTGLMLLFIFPSPQPAQAQGLGWTFTFTTTGVPVFDPQYNYTSAYGEETNRGCWGTYAKAFGSGGDGNPGPDGNIITWGSISADGKITGGCLIQENPTNGYLIKGQIKGGVYHPDSNTVTGLDIETSEKVTNTDASGKVSWALTTLTFKGDLRQSDQPPYSHQGDVSVTYVEQTDSSNGDLRNFTGTQTILAQISPKQAGQPPAPQPAAGGQLTITAMGCYVDSHQAGTVICIPTPINAPANTPVTFAWSMDGQSLSSTDQTLTQPGVTAGEHSFSVTASAGSQTTPAYSTLIVVPDPASPAPFSVSLDCKVSGTSPDRSAACTATPKGGTDASALTYKWYFEGAENNSSTNNTLTLSSLEARQYGVQVKVTDPGSGKSALAFNVIRSEKKAAATPGSGQVQVITPGGSAVITPGQTTNVPVKSGQPAQVKARCNLQDFLWASLLYGNPKFMVNLPGSGDQIDVRFLIVYLNCLKLSSGPLPAPFAFAADRSLALPLASSRASSITDMPIQAVIDLPAGPLRIQVTHPQATITVETDTATVTSQGLGDFEVAYDPDNGQSTIAAYQGSVQIEPKNSNLAPLTLGEGQQVQVSQDEVGQVSQAASPAGTTSDSNMGIILIGLCCCGLVLVLTAAMILFFLLRRRSKTR